MIQGSRAGRLPKDVIQGEVAIQPPSWCLMYTMGSSQSPCGRRYSEPHFTDEETETGVP